MKIQSLFALDNVLPCTYTREVACHNPDLIIGLELETENCSLDGRAYNQLLAPLNIDVTTDGSLRGAAYEFITRPMRSAHALAALTDYFAMTQFNEQNFTDRCSVHVHVNCLDLDQSEVSSVALLYTIIEEILMEYVGHNRDSNLYCIPWSHCRQHWDLVYRFLNDPGHTLKSWNKYTALNLLPLVRQGTIEFRQLYGTADMTVITQWINIIGSIMSYAKRTPLKVLMEQIKEMNTVSNYEVFFREVLSNHLPYNDIYRQKLEEGVVLAKYGMMSMTKKPSSKKAPVREITGVPSMWGFNPDTMTIGAVTATTGTFIRTGTTGRTTPQNREVAHRRLQEMANELRRATPQPTLRTRATFDLDLLDDELARSEEEEGDNE